LPNIHFHHGFSEQRLCHQGAPEFRRERPGLRGIVERTRGALSQLRDRILGSNVLRQPLTPVQRVDGMRTQTRGLVQGLLEGTVDLGIRGARALARSPVARGVMPAVAGADVRVNTVAGAVRDQRNLPAEQLTAYHQSLLHVPGQPETRNQMFEYFPGSGPEPRRLLVLAMGNRQGFSTQDVGMRQLQQRFAGRPDVDVLLVRSGNAGSDMRAGRSGDVTDTTAVTMSHIENIVHARVNARGMFAGQRPPSSIAMAGFSFGGGAIAELSDRWNQMGTTAPVTGVALLDPIRLGARHMGEPVTTRPAVAGRVLHLYQDSSLSRTYGAPRRSVAVRGAPLTNPQPGDTVRLIRNAGHRELQSPELHNTDVLDPTFDFLNRSLT
jgi:hypothetical protein